MSTLQPDPTLAPGAGEPLDAVTAAPDSHPVGTGIGAALGGAAAGALAGSVAGPVGTVIGIAVGAIAGGLAGRDVAAMVDPALEEVYWRGNYRERAYVQAGSSFDDYGPAYAYGVTAHGRYPGRTFDDAEPELSQAWNDVRGASSLDWNRARPATRDAWKRASETSERVESVVEEPPARG